MSKPRESWWGYAKNMVRSYYGLADRYRRTGHLPEAKRREYHAVDQAIQRTAALPTGAERLKVVELVLLKGTHNIAGAALEANISEQTAKIYHRDFLYLVGSFRGLT